MNEKPMLSLRSVLAGSGAVLALYIGLYVYLLYRDFPPDGRQRAIGLGALAGLAMEMLFWSAFGLAAVAVFFVAAYLARK
jgi:hypothetical protein